jgi:hypothetical protein
MPEEGRSYEGPSPYTVASSCHPLSILSSPKNTKENSNSPIITLLSRTTAEAPVPDVTRTSFRSMNRGFNGLPVRDHRTGEQSVEGAKQLFKLIFFIKLMRETHKPLGGEWVGKIQRPGVGP